MVMLSASRTADVLPQCACAQTQKWAHSHSYFVNIKLQNYYLNMNSAVSVLMNGADVRYWFLLVLKHTACDSSGSGDCNVFIRT